MPGGPKRYRVGVVALHPIQYQAGLWRTMARHPRLDVEVLYLDTVGVDGSVDPTMGAAMQWDVPLLEGHAHAFVRNLSPLRFTPVLHRVNPGLPARIRRGDYDALVVHGYLTISNWLALVAARRHGVKLVYRGEGSMRGGARHDHPLVNALKSPVNRFYLRHCDAIAYSSRDNRDYLLSRGAPPERLFPMPCAVDNEVLETLAAKADPQAFRARHHLPADAPLVINVGRFRENKRTRDCIDALAAPALRERSDVHLLIAGDGPLRGELEKQAHDLGLADRVHFLGFLGQREIVEAVLASDVFVLASARHDPSPKALSEALFLRRPAVCAEGVGTCRDLIRDGENGFVVPTAAPERLAAALAEVLRDPVRHREMGERSHAIARRDDFQAGVDSLVEHLDRSFPELGRPPMEGGA